ncbi:MAG: hypothetical protein AAF265_10340 [Pseudomonadota bacterium]
MTTLALTALSVANFYAGPGSGSGDDPLLPLPQCDDDVDNDGDGLPDLLDPDCLFSNDDSEEGDPGDGGDGGDDGQGGCDATVPPSVVTSLVLVPCTQDGLTILQVGWLHACPSQVDVYDLETRQPDSVFSPYLYKGTTPNRTATWFVGGASARLRVRSCGQGGCSAYSTDTAFLPYLCSNF